jgi:hypothetical protein
VRNDDETSGRDLADRLERLERIIGKRFRHNASDDVAIVHHVNRVPVSGRVGDRIGCDRSCGTRSVLDHERLAEFLLK